MDALLATLQIECRAPLPPAQAQHDAQKRELERNVGRLERAQRKLACAPQSVLADLDRVDEQLEAVFAAHDRALHDSLAARRAHAAELRAQTLAGVDELATASVRAARLAAEVLALRRRAHRLEVDGARDGAAFRRRRAAADLLAQLHTVYILAAAGFSDPIAGPVEWESYAVPRSNLAMEPAQELLGRCGVPACEDWPAVAPPRHANPVEWLARWYEHKHEVGVPRSAFDEFPDLKALLDAA